MSVTDQEEYVTIDPSPQTQAGAYDFTFTLKPAYPNIGVSRSFGF